MIIYFYPWLRCQKLGRLFELKIRVSMLKLLWCRLNLACSLSHPEAGTHHPSNVNKITWVFCRRNGPRTFTLHQYAMAGQCHEACSAASLVGNSIFWWVDIGKISNFCCCSLLLSVCVGKLVKMNHLTMARVGAQERTERKVESKQPISRRGGCDMASSGCRR